MCDLRSQFIMQFFAVTRICQSLRRSLSHLRMPVIPGQKCEFIDQVLKIRPFQLICRFISGRAAESGEAHLNRFADVIVIVVANRPSTLLERGLDADACCH